MELKYRRLAKNTFLFFLGGALTKVVSLLMLPFYTRHLSVEDYGATDLLVIYVSLITGLATLCISEAIFIFVKKADIAERNKYLSSGLYYTFILFFLLAIVFKLIQYVIYQTGADGIFVRYCWHIYALILTGFLQTFTQQFACAIDKMKIYSFAGFVYAISLAVTSFFIIPQYKVDGYVFSIILANLFTIFYTFTFSKSYKYLRLSGIDFHRYQELVSYSLLLIPNSLMWWVVGSLNRPVMEINIGLDAIGLFAIANKFPSVLNMIFQYFASSWQVSVSEEYEKDNFVIFFNKILKSFFFLLIFISGILTLFSREILYITTSEDYHRAFIYIPFLCLGAVFNSISGSVGSIFAVVKKSKYFFYTSLYGAITSVLLNFLLIPLWGIWGAVISMALSFAVIAYSRIFYAGKFVKISNSLFYVSLSLMYLFFSLFVIWCDNLLSNIVVMLMAYMVPLSIYRKQVLSMLNLKSII